MEWLLVTTKSSNVFSSLDLSSLCHYCYYSPCCFESKRSRVATVGRASQLYLSFWSLQLQPKKEHRGYINKIGCKRGLASSSRLVWSGLVGIIYSYS